MENFIMLHEASITKRHPVKAAAKSWHFAEFFAGIGLVRMGLEKADSRLKCAFANDLSASKRRIYASHFGCDLGEIDSSDVHKLLASSVPDVELATASFPCTSLSVAGGRAGIRNGESAAFWGFHRVLSEMGRIRRPFVVLLENVVGLLDSHCGKDFRDALQSMNDLGYAVDPFILNARWFVPQSRPRLFVVCIRKEFTDQRQRIEMIESRIRPAKLVSFIRSNFDEIDWSIRQLPDPPAKSSQRLRDIIRNPRSNHKDWWNRERVTYLFHQMFPVHQRWIEEQKDSKSYSYATAFRRMRAGADGKKRSMAELRTDGVAGCLRTPKGGSARQILVRVGRGRMDARLLSAVECASLMGADGYSINGSLNEALFGFGDAVCVHKISWIAQHYLVPILESVALTRGQFQNNMTILQAKDVC